MRTEETRPFPRYNNGGGNMEVGGKQPKKTNGTEDQQGYQFGSMLRRQPQDGEGRRGWKGGDGGGRSRQRHNGSGAAEEGATGWWC
jgi:hypothetical protein